MEEQPALCTTEPSVQSPSIILLDLFLPLQSGCLTFPVGRGLFALVQAEVSQGRGHVMHCCGVLTDTEDLCPLNSS